MMAETSNGVDGRRACLQKNDFSTFPPTAHAGLWIDKFLPHQEKGAGQKKADHFEQAARHSVDDVYKNFFKRWQKSLAEAGAQTHEAKVNGRLAIGLGGESVLETAISLHRTYGVPYIPGSALKGLAAHYVRNRLGEQWQDGSEAYKILFGDPKNAGYVTFYDALYVPNTATKNTPLALDVINVHHPDYYGEKKDGQGKSIPPADWDSPTPVSFLSATGSYLIALGGPAEWVKAAFEILACALREEGIGAKTSSGYGRMEFESDDKEQPPQKEPYALIQKRVLAETPPSGRFRGTVVTVKETYAFINPAKGGGQMFLHIDQVREKKQLRQGQVVEYRHGIHKGKTQAQDAEILLETED